MIGDGRRSLWKDTWPTWRTLVAHFVSGLIGGSAAVGICLLLFALTFYPIGALVVASPLGSGYTYERGFSLAADGAVFVLPLVFASVVAGPIGAWLTSGIRRALRSATPVRRRPSSVLWAVGVAIISGGALWIYPLTAGRPVTLAIVIGACAASIGMLDALLSYWYVRHVNQQHNRMDRYSR